MRTLMRISLIAISVLTFNSCITHYPMDNYAKYLSNNEGTLDLPKSKLAISYDMDQETEKHIKQIRSVMTGWAHKWMIEYGKALNATMESKDVKSAFASVSKGTNKESEKGTDVQINFSIVEFDFRDHQAVIVVKATVLNKKGVKVLSEKYSANGISQGGKMFWAGAFGMQNAIHQSTKSAMDTIMKKLFEDIRAKLKSPQKDMS